MRLIQVVFLAFVVIVAATVVHSAERRYLPRPSEYASTPYPYEDIVPGGWAALMPLVNKQVSVTSIVLYPALSAFVRYEGRLPADMRELLDSPYSPVSSADLKDPVLDISYANLKPGQVLSEWYTFEGSSDLSKAVITMTSYFRDPWTREVVEVPYRHPATDFLDTKLGENCVYRYDRSSVDIQDVKARVIEDALRMAAGEFKRHHRRAPRSHDEVVSTFPYLARLRNPYSGDLARLEGSRPKTELSPLKGTPGNFFFIEDSFLPRYIVFGRDGYGIRVVPAKIPVGPCPGNG